MTLDLRAAAVAARWGITGCALVMLVACGMLRATGAGSAALVGCWICALGLIARESWGDVGSARC